MVEDIQRTSSQNQQVIKHTAWRDARKQSLALLADGKIPCVLGPQGTGKSILLADIKERLGLSGIQVHILDRSYEPLGHLAGAYVIDDAETLPLVTLKNVTLWAKVCVLAGGEALRALLNELPDRVVVVEMSGILPADLASYTQEILRRRGMPLDFFAGNQLESLHRQTGGIPKSINGVVALAAFVATSDKTANRDAGPHGEAPTRADAGGNKAGQEIKGVFATEFPDRQLDFAGGDLTIGLRPARSRAVRSAGMIGALMVVSLAVASQIPGILPVSFAQFLSAATYRARENPVMYTPTAATVVATPDTEPPAPNAAPIEPPVNPEIVAAAPVLLAHSAEAPAPPANTAVAVFPLLGPGLVLLVRDGDSLQSLYAQIYQGVAPPPFNTVAAMNRFPLASGSIAVFPAPAAGWRAN